MPDVIAELLQWLGCLLMCDWHWSKSSIQKLWNQQNGVRIWFTTREVFILLQWQRENCILLQWLLQPASISSASPFLLSKCWMMYLVLLPFLLSRCWMTHLVLLLHQSGAHTWLFSVHASCGRHPVDIRYKEAQTVCQINMQSLGQKFVIWWLGCRVSGASRAYWSVDSAWRAPQGSSTFRLGRQYDSIDLLVLQ